MRKPIVIPNGVRDLTQTHGPRNQPTALIASTGRSLAVCAAREDTAFFYRALVQSEFKFL
jgi:hypothetical protein